MTGDAMSLRYYSLQFMFWKFVQKLGSKHWMYSELWVVINRLCSTFSPTLFFSIYFISWFSTKTAKFTIHYTNPFAVMCPIFCNHKAPLEFITKKLTTCTHLGSALTRHPFLLHTPQTLFCHWWVLKLASKQLLNSSPELTLLRPLHSYFNWTSIPFTHSMMMHKHNFSITKYLISLTSNYWKFHQNFSTPP